MFTERAQAAVERAKDHAFSRDQAEIDLAAVVFAVVHAGQGSLLLADCLGSSDEALRQGTAGPRELRACPGRLSVSATAHTLLTSARELAQEYPDRHQPGLVDVRHLAAALALSPEACTLLRVGPASRETVTRHLASAPDHGAATAALSALAERLRRMQAEMRERIFGQDHAVHAFVEGIFHAEVVAAADTARRGPRAVFVFAGPPGAGRACMAEMGASCLGRPFLRLELGGFPGHHQEDALVGTSPTQAGAHPGRLTGFVDQNPDAVLLFDDLEQARDDTVRLLLQILDAGCLEDRYTERPVSFRDTIIVFTTQVGRRLYERPNESGIHAAHAGFQRRTILDALEGERDPRSGEALFPPALCSRMATGTPILFHPLGVGDLVRVVRAEMTRVAGLLLRQTGKRVSFDSQVPLAVLLREGARADARTLRTQAEAFVRAEWHGFCPMFKSDRLEDVLEQVDEIRFLVEGAVEEMGDGLAPLLRPQGPFGVLLVAPPETCDLCREALPEFDWQCASDADDALGCLSRQDVDLVLVDLLLDSALRRMADTLRGGDPVPSAARSLAAGQEVLRRLHERAPEAPIYLLAHRKRGEAPEAGGPLDDELLAACIRGGGARGVVATSLAPPLGVGSKGARDRLAADLREICVRLVQERAAAALGRQRRVLAFETASTVVNGVAEVRLRGLRLARGLASADARELLEDVEYPATRFDDCIGAEVAKAELAPCVDYLRHPGRFAALGLEAPRALLLHGPPGTGKTTLARAVAGESEVALVQVSASRFLTLGPGGGAQGVRDVFARARRHAPALVFIDDIDAIGEIRAHRFGGGGAEQDILDALLVEMDDFGAPSTPGVGFVLAATRFPMDDDEGGDGASSKRLDPALLRRFSRRVLVALPHRAVREQYLRLRLAGRPCCTITPELVSLVAERSPGTSIANLEAVIEAAARAASESDGVLTDAFLENAFEGGRFGETRVRSQEEVIRTACHEAGHTLMYWLAGWWPAYVTVVSHGGHGGHMARCSEEAEQQGSRTRPQLLADIRVSLGGRAAELVYYGADDGLSTGAAGDLAEATRQARAMVCRFGMVEEFGVLATPELLRVEAALGSAMSQQVNAEAAKILKNQMAETAHLMRMYQERLDAVAQALAHRERLTREELQAILGPRYASGNELRGDVGR